MISNWIRFVGLATLCSLFAILNKPSFTNSSNHSEDISQLCGSTLMVFLSSRNERLKVEVSLKKTCKYLSNAKRQNGKDFGYNEKEMMDILEEINKFLSLLIKTSTKV